MAEKATRDSFGETLRDLGAEMPNLVVLDADLSVSTKSALFAQRYPDRFFQMGIAESNMVGTAAGLSFTGYVPFLCSFGAFVVGRYETIRVSVGYSRANVKIVGTHAGLGTGEDGYTQMGLEDVSVLRALPGITILQPSDHRTTVAAVKAAARTNGPFYLRLTRQKVKDIHDSEAVFQIGRGIVIRKGEKLALLGTGAATGEILLAASGLEAHRPWVVDFPTLKPFDTQLMAQLARQCTHIVTVEDHSVIGGLGSAAAESLAEAGFGGKLLRIGIGEVYGESGDAKTLYDKFGISAARVVERVGSWINS